MAQDRKKATVYSNGINRYMAIAVGGVAGELTTVVGDIDEGDEIVQVLAATYDTGVPSAVTDLTDEFSITGKNTIDNTGGTATTDQFLYILYDAAWYNTQDS